MYILSCYKNDDLLLNRKNAANKEKRNNEGDQTEEDNDQEEVFTLLQTVPLQHSKYTREI